MLLCDGLSLANETFVTDGRQGCPAFGLTDFEPGDLRRTYCSPLVRFRYPLSRRPTVPPPTLSTPYAHTLHDNTPVADVGFPSVDSLPPAKAPRPYLLERLSGDQRTSFLHIWGGLPLHFREITFNPYGSGEVSISDRFLGQRPLYNFPAVFLTS